MKTENQQAFVYIMANKRNGTIYIGVTNNLSNRVWQHKQNVIESFTKKYSIHRLIYFEQHGSIHLAIEREKQIKKWRRQWKLELIERANPGWSDLYDSII